MSRVLILSGHDRYADPWHRFDTTSAMVASILREDGHTVDLADHVEESLADLTDVDLLVVNAGNPARPDEGPSTTAPAARRGLLEYRRRGGGVLAMHAAASSLPHIEEWSDIIGGRWVQGVSMHPEIGAADIKIHDAHPVTAGIGHVSTFDERYSYLETRPGITILGSHFHDGVEHPMIWAVDAEARSVYIGLGHDERAYEAESVRRLVRQAANWTSAAR